MNMYSMNNNNEVVTEEEDNGYLDASDRLNIFNETISDIFDNDRDRLEKLIEEISEKNSRLNGKSGKYCFIYKGGSFYNEGERPSIQLHESLLEEMKLTAKQLNQTREAERSIKYYIRKIIVESKTRRDIKFLTPDWLEQYIHLPEDGEKEIHEEELTLSDDFKNQFDTLNEFHIDIIKSYIFTRELFFNN